MTAASGSESRRSRRLARYTLEVLSLVTIKTNQNPAPNMLTSHHNSIKAEAIECSLVIVGSSQCRYGILYSEAYVQFTRAYIPKRNTEMPNWTDLQTSQSKTESAAMADHSSRQLIVRVRKRSKHTILVNRIRSSAGCIFSLPHAR